MLGVKYQRLPTLFIYAIHFPSAVTLRNFLTTWSKVRLDRVNGSQLVKEIPTLYGTRMFITAFTRTLHLSLS